MGHGGIYLNLNQNELIFPHIISRSNIESIIESHLFNNILLVTPCIILGHPLYFIINFVLSDLYLSQYILSEYIHLYALTIYICEIIRHLLKT